MKIRSLFAPLIFMVLVQPVQAQLYKTNIGVRLDESQFGLSLDQKIYKQLTASAAVDAASRELKGTVYLRYHKKILGRRLNIYPAFGVHTGRYKNFGSFSGFDLMIGAEYKMILLPIVLSFDVAPSFHTGGNHPDWYNFQTVFSIKYVMVKDRKKKKGWFKKKGK